MAYNYFPVNYQPYYQQPAQTSIIWVSGEKEAQMYPVAPNNAVTLWSQSEPVVYVKKADATGRPTLSAYDLIERVESAPAGTVAQEAKVVPYASRDELKAITEAVSAYDESISSIKAEIEAIKSDLYGLAGKKRKKEVEDE